MTFSVMFYHTT